MMAEPNYLHPWVSFCMSTYKRPGFLKEQLTILSRQSFKFFEVIISDNDPEGSGEEVVESFADNRFSYFNNGVNLGMVQSFNKSIDRASTEFIVMITDDDPVEEDFLEEMYKLYVNDNTCSLYAGLNRKNLNKGQVEKILPEDFIKEILDVNKTYSLLWSSCVMKRADVLAVGKMPDYGSPHFTDQALIAMTGSIGGGLVVNKMFSSLSAHDSNFSKSNFQLYIPGCIGFYNCMDAFCKEHPKYEEESKAVLIHLNKWFFGCIFPLKKYFTLNGDSKKHEQIVECAHQILMIPFMKKFKLKYYAKVITFELKKMLGVLK